MLLLFWIIHFKSKSADFLAGQGPPQIKGDMEKYLRDKTGARDNQTIIFWQCHQVKGIRKKMQFTRLEAGEWKPNLSSARMFSTGRPVYYNK